MNDFYLNDAGRAEDMLMDPLILHTDLVKDRVIAEVVDRTIPKRLYAIGFLGVAGVTEALPVLRTILADESEEDTFRRVALTSIYQISPEEGLTLAKQYQARSDDLGSAAGEIVDGSARIFTRTYWEAFWGRHH